MFPRPSPRPPPQALAQDPKHRRCSTGHLKADLSSCTKKVSLCSSTASRTSQTEATLGAAGQLCSYPPTKLRTRLLSRQGPTIPTLSLLQGQLKLAMKTTSYI